MVLVYRLSIAHSVCVVGGYGLSRVSVSVTVLAETPLVVGSFRGGAMTLVVFIIDFRFQLYHYLLGVGSCVSAAGLTNIFCRAGMCSPVCARS